MKTEVWVTWLTLHLLSNFWTFKCLPPATAIAAASSNLSTSASALSTDMAFFSRFCTTDSVSSLTSTASAAPVSWSLQEFCSFVLVMCCDIISSFTSTESTCGDITSFPLSGLPTLCFFRGDSLQTSLLSTNEWLTLAAVWSLFSRLWNTSLSSSIFLDSLSGKHTSDFELSCVSGCLIWETSLIPSRGVSANKKE